MSLLANTKRQMLKYNDGTTTERVENEEQVIEDQQKIQENNEETTNQPTEEATQPMQNKNDGALKSKLKRINENQSCRSVTKAVAFTASATQKAIETKRRLLGNNRKHEDEMDENLKDTAGREIIIMGGLSADHGVLSSVTIFDPVTGTYEEIPAMNYPRCEAASCVYNNDVIVSGGFEGERDSLYQDTIEILKTNQHPLRWTIFQGSLRSTLCSHVLIVYQEKLLVIGGFDLNGRRTSDEIYELISTPPYTRMFPARMPQPREYHRAEIVNGKLFILGGKTANDSSYGINSVIMYDPTRNEFIECAPLPWPVSGMSTVTWRNKIVVIGGEDIHNEDLNDVFMYDPESGECEPLPPLNQPRSGATAVILNDVIFVFGGYNFDDGHLNSVESFTMGGDQEGWIEQPRMTEQRLDATALVKLGNRREVCSM